MTPWIQIGQDLNLTEVDQLIAVTDWKTMGEALGALTMPLIQHSALKTLVIEFKRIVGADPQPDWAKKLLSQY